jgi:6-phosphogluconolactonase
VQSFGNDSLPHEVAIDPSGQFAFIPLKGANAIAQFRFDGTSGKLTANTPARVTTAVGAGPRHMAFHSSGKFAYVINEQASTMVAYTLDTMGRLTEMQSLTTRPAGATTRPRKPPCTCRASGSTDRTEGTTTSSSILSATPTG